MISDFVTSLFAARREKVLETALLRSYGIYLIVYSVRYRALADTALRNHGHGQPEPVGR